MRLLFNFQLFLAGLVVSGSALSIVNGPYIINLKTTQATIQWETNDSTGSSEVYLGTSESDLNPVTPGPGKRNAHGTELNRPWGTNQDAGVNSQLMYYQVLQGLEPGTRYYYKIKLDNNFSPVYSFRAAPPPWERTCAFVVYGDCRSNSSTHASILNRMETYFSGAGKEIGFVLNGGDFVKTGGEYNHWRDQVFNPGSDFWPNHPMHVAIGNHEAHSTYGMAHWTNYYFTGLNLGEINKGNYYSFTYGNLECFSLNSNQFSEEGGRSGQKTWFENAISASSAVWKIVVFHHPTYAVGNKGDDSEGMVANGNYIPLFQEHGVDIIFSSHDHNYQRFDKDNLIYVVTGGGAAPLYGQSGSDPRLVVFKEENHFCAVEIDETTLSLKAINRSGSTIDQFTITKQVSSSGKVSRSYRSALDLKITGQDPAVGVKMQYSIPREYTGNIHTLQIHDVRGRTVRTLRSGRTAVGSHYLIWDAKDRYGQAAANGFYVARLHVDGHTRVAKISLFR